MNLKKERENLADVLADLEERLEDFKDLFKNTVKFDLDYSEESLQYVELLLSRIKPQMPDDKDLMKDAALYIGETLRRIHGGRWEIFVDVDKQSEFHTQPCIIDLDAPIKVFFPFLAIQDFCKKPTLGYIESVLKNTKMKSS